MTDNLDSTPNPLTITGWQMWCHKHLQPLKAGWEDSIIPQTIAMVGLFQEAASDPRMHVLTEGRAEAIQRVMNEVRPVCCWLPEGIAEAIIQSALRREPYFNPAWPEDMRIKPKDKGHD